MKKNYREILIGAFRYALGRQTYYPSIVVDEIVKHWDEFSETTKKLFLDEIYDEIEILGLLPDMGTWKRVLELEV